MGIVRPVSLWLAATSFDRLVEPRRALFARNAEGFALASLESTPSPRVNAPIARFIRVALYTGTRAAWPDGDLSPALSRAVNRISDIF
jgi:hypothetical protein